MGWVHALVVVGAWRLASELVQRRRQLDAAGVLDRRLRARRTSRIIRALDAAGLPAPRDRVLAAVHVGVVRDHDVDDVDLLEGSMRRATRRLEVVRPATDWGRLLDAASADQPAARERTREPERAPACATPIAAGGVALTAVALVRPLADAAPWLALGGLALAAAGWIASRRG